MYLLSSLRFDGQLLQTPCTVEGDSPCNTSTEAFITREEGSYAIALTGFDPHRVHLHTPGSDALLTHGSHFGPASLAERTITLHGQLRSHDPQGQEAGMAHLHALFSVVAVPSLLDDGTRTLQWEDHRGRHLHCQARVQDFLPVIDQLTPCLTPFSVTLSTCNPAIYVGENPITTTLREGSVGGLQLSAEDTGQPRPLSVAQYSDVWNPLTITIEHCSSALRLPLSITITVDPTWVCPQSLPPHAPGYQHSYSVGGHLTISHLESGDFVQLQHAMGPTDTLSILGDTGTVLLNGTPRPELLHPQSSGFPALQRGENTLVLSDDTHPQAHGQALIASVSYWEVL
ncbi:hypothetical protein H6771_02670 [Candidatus Peribacteria bacterium]|nr:hypothetical protein [Candidatus Peribacteria bacterium]